MYPSSSLSGLPPEKGVTVTFVGTPGLSELECREQQEGDEERVRKRATEILRHSPE